MVLNRNTKILAIMIQALENFEVEHLKRQFCPLIMSYWRSIQSQTDPANIGTLLMTRELLIDSEIAMMEKCIGTEILFKTQEFKYLQM